MKQYLKYFVQAIPVFIGILLSFYIDNQIISSGNTNYKNELVKDLQTIIDSETNQINNIRDLQYRCLKA